MLFRSFEAILNNEIRSLFFDGLKFVASGKPKLVTYSKALHFFIPNLIAPIDRRYTLNYFFGNTSVPKTDFQQFEKFILVQKTFQDFSRQNNLSRYKNGYWNSSVPKILDNMIIGYLKS